MRNGLPQHRDSGKRWGEFHLKTPGVLRRLAHTQVAKIVEDFDPLRRAVQDAPTSTETVDDPCHMVDIIGMVGPYKRLFAQNVQAAVESQNQMIVVPAGR